MRSVPLETYPELLELEGIAHGFVLRQAGVAVSTDREETVQHLRPGFDLALGEVGFDPGSLASAEQVHGGLVARVESGSHRLGVDGLITNVPGVALGILVADCCAVYLVDPVKRAVGLVHSGKKGTEAGISVVAIDAMRADFGSKSEDLVVRLSPCIRPPVYEVDIAELIRAQVAEAGVLAGSIYDDGICTSSDLEKYYSYRVEKGATGRMMAVLGLI